MPEGFQSHPALLFHPFHELQGDEYQLQYVNKPRKE
jgi:hypothetical protein